MMMKKNVLLLNYYIGNRRLFKSPLFYGNALYWLEAYLESFDEISERYSLKVVNFEGMDYLNHNKTNDKDAAILNAVLSEEPDVIAFSLYVWNVVHAHELAEALKAMAPEVLIIAGGPEVNDRADFCKDFQAFDVLVEGEGEIAFKAILARFAEGKRDLDGIPNVSFKKNGAFVHNESSLLLEDIEAIPNFYKSNKPLLYGRGFYMTTRGCPYNCDMCLYARQPMRRKSRARIMEELGSLVVDTDLSFLVLFDYDLLEICHRDKSLFREIEDLVGRKGGNFGINFFINPRYMVDERLGEVMAKLRSKHVLVGLQSMSERALRAINRGWSADFLDVFEKVPKDLRGKLYIELIFPLPEQTAAEFIDSVKYLLSLGYFRLQVFLLSVLRGTALYRRRDELRLRYHRSPPYICFETPEVSARDFLRVGVLAHLLNLVLVAADAYWDDTPFVEYFARTPDVVDRLLERIEKKQQPEEIARGLVGEILGVDYHGRFHDANSEAGRHEWPDAETLFPSSTGRVQTPQVAVEPEAQTGPSRIVQQAAPAFWFEEDLRKFFKSLKLERIKMHAEPGGFRLTVDRDGRSLEISLFLKKIARPYFRATRFYKVAYNGSEEDIGIVEETVRFISELETKAPRDGSGTSG